MEEGNGCYKITLHFGTTTLDFDFNETQEQNLTSLKNALVNKSVPLEIKRDANTEEYVDLNKVLYYSIKRN